MQLHNTFQLKHPTERGLQLVFEVYLALCMRVRTGVERTDAQTAPGAPLSGSVRFLPG